MNNVVVKNKNIDKTEYNHLLRKKIGTFRRTTIAFILGAFTVINPSISLPSIPFNTVMSSVTVQKSKVNASNYLADSQIGIAFGKHFHSKTVSAVIKANNFSNTTAIMINGLSNNKVWYQFGIEEYKKNYSYFLEIWDKKGNSIIEQCGSKEIFPEAVINSGDVIKLSMSISNKKITFDAKDITSNEEDKLTYKSSGSNFFVGSSKGVNKNGYFTGFMEESYPTNNLRFPYTMGSQTFEFSKFMNSNVYAFMDETLEKENCTQSLKKIIYGYKMIWLNKQVHQLYKGKAYDINVILNSRGVSIKKERTESFYFKEKIKERNKAWSLKTWIEKIRR